MVKALQPEWQQEACGGADRREKCFREDAGGEDQADRRLRPDHAAGRREVPFVEKWRNCKKGIIRWKNVTLRPSLASGRQPQDSLVETSGSGDSGLDSRRAVSLSSLKTPASMAGEQTFSFGTWTSERSGTSFKGLVTFCNV